LKNATGKKNVPLQEIAVTAHIRGR
jgi:hypothetical protein